MAIDMAQNDNLQRLFLLEILVDNINFIYEKIDLSESTLNILQQTCVRFKFLDFPMVEICEEDFCKTQETYDKTSKIFFKNGKSFFFSLSCLPADTRCLQLGAIVVRHKEEPPPVVIGTSCVILDRGFVDVLNGVAGSCEDCKTLQDIFPIFDERGIIIGSLTVLVRLSCFGKSIITKFMVDQEEEEKYMFANTKDKALKVKPKQIQTKKPKPPVSHEHSDADSIGRPPGCCDDFDIGIYKRPKGVSPNKTLQAPPNNAPGNMYSNTWATLQNTPNPCAQPGTFPNTTPGMYYGNGPTPNTNTWGTRGFPPQSPAATLPGTSDLYPEIASENLLEADYVPGFPAGNVPESDPGKVPGKGPGKEGSGSLPGASSGKFPGNIPGTAPNTFPESAHGKVPGGTPSNVSGDSSGTFPGATPGNVPGKSTAPNAFPGDPTGTYPNENGESAITIALSKNENLQRLFLLELLVDNVNLDYERTELSESTLNILKQTCVRFKFLDFPVIQVCEEDFCRSQGKYDRTSNIIFKNGKSYFFPLSRLPRNTRCLYVGATIVRLKDQQLPVLIGTSCIVLDQGFMDMLDYNEETSQGSKTLKDRFPILDERGITIGSLTMLVRLSCFGKAIITHFKVPEDKDAGYMFANTKDQGQKPEPDPARIRPPVFHGYSDTNQGRPPGSNNKNNLFYESQQGARIPEMVVGNNPIDPPSNAPVSPYIYRGFPDSAPGDVNASRNKTGGMYRENIADLPQLAPGTLQNSSDGMQPGKKPVPYSNPSGSTLQSGESRR